MDLKANHHYMCKIKLLNVTFRVPSDLIFINASSRLRRQLSNGTSDYTLYKELTTKKETYSYHK